jgi:hypothetical protein
MKEIKANKHKILLYTDIEELPSWRFLKFNKFILIDAYAGSSIDKIDERFANLYLMAKNEDTAKMKNEINNLRQSIYFALMEINPSMMAFCALIHSIDREIIIDLSEDGIARIQEKLKDIPVSIMMETVMGVKKK